MTSEGARPTVTPRLALWIEALRAPFITASAVPVLVGGALAFWATGNFLLERFLLCLGGVVCLHLGANLANDYFDYVTGCDAANPEPTPFSGGSRMIQRGLISARATMAASAAFFALGAVQGIALELSVPGHAVTWLGLAGLAGGLLYSATPAKLSYRGVGELVIFALFGPLAVVGTYLCQTDGLALLPLVVSVPLGLQVTAVLLVNEVLDVRWDGLAGKRTMVVRLGERRGYALYLGVYLAAYAWLAAGAVAGVYSRAALVALVPAVIFLKDLLPARALRDRGATINASRLTVLSHTISGCLVTATYLVSRLM
ncbi:MAG: 1,4-dihydroxy-2-naphthoate octaprenyltransferase [bacterium]